MNPEGLEPNGGAGEKGSSAVGVMEKVGDLIAVGAGIIISADFTARVAWKALFVS